MDLFGQISDHNDDQILIIFEFSCPSFFNPKWWKSGDDDKMFDMFIAQERRIQFSKRRLSFLQAMIRGNELENQNHWRRMARSVVW